MRLMWFNSLAEHVPGRQMVVADTLSISPLKFGQVFSQVIGTTFNRVICFLRNTNISKDVGQSVNCLMEQFVS